MISLLLQAKGPKWSIGQMIIEWEDIHEKENTRGDSLHITDLSAFLTFQ